MDVKCERCNTEYEFDDALVSGRGTTVKCTNCGHKFKIRRSDGDFSEDFWNVTTGDGRTLVFTSLRELQRAIQGYLVERNDRLSRGGLPPKAIGQIPELAPFFEQRESAKRSQQAGKQVKTQDGLGPAAAQVAAHPPPPPKPRQPTKPEFPAPPAGQETWTQEPAKPAHEAPSASAQPGKATLIGTGPSGEGDVVGSGPTRTERPAPPPGRSLPPPVPAARPPMNTVPMHRPTPTPGSVQPYASRAPAARASIPPPLPDRARRTTESRPSGSIEAVAPAPAVQQASPPVADSSSPIPPAPRIRSLLSEIEDDRDQRGGPSSTSDPPPASRRRSVGGFVVSAVVVGCLLMLGAVWAQKNLGTTLGTKPVSSAQPSDPRAMTFLATGEKALADGNLELAKESFDKASALAERDPHVLLDVARLAAVRADVFWLKSRLLPSDATDEHRVTRDSLMEMAASARRAADEALTEAPDDPSAVRAKIDALRISGDRDGARALVGKLPAGANQPETAYVLAALDLAEVEPLWPTVIERLKTASGAETGPGRSRALLVFALARSGDAAGARAEVDRLTAMTKPHPLLPLLRAFAEKGRTNTRLDAGTADAAVAAADAGRLVIGAHGGQVSGGGGGLPGDTRELVAQGERARGKGDYEKARTLFTAATDKNPNDSEALAGLAAIAYAQHDLAGARTAFKRVLGINPNYMPALVGLADVEWDSGDKGSATKMYKDIVDRYPEGAYPGRVKQRSEGGG